MKEPDHQAAYYELGELLATAPTDLPGPAPLSAETHRWLGRVTAIVESQGTDPLADSAAAYDAISIKSATSNLGLDLLRGIAAHEVISILNRALARAERRAPAAAQGTYIGVGGSFTTIQGVAKVVREAARDVMFLDPYMDATILTDFAPLVPERMNLRVFTDPADPRWLASLRPAAARWIKQYGSQRPLEAKVSPAKALHDRLIIVDDGASVWNLSQSFKDIGGRSPASLSRLPEHIARPKLNHYLPLWVSSSPLT